MKLKKTKRKRMISMTLVVILTVFFGQTVFAIDDSQTAAFIGQYDDSNFGIANDFNFFILGNFTMGGVDVEGRIAVGGNAAFNGYTVGSVYQKDVSTRTKADVIVGGNANGTGLSNQSGWTVVGGSKANSPCPIDNGNKSATVYDTKLIDFDSVKKELIKKSNYWSTLIEDVNSTATVIDYYGTLKLKGTDKTINIFNVTQDQLNKSSGIDFDVPDSSTVLVNVTDSNIVWPSNGQMSYMGVGINKGDAIEQHIVWNFPNATSVTGSSISIKGSILAPNAAWAPHGGNVEGNCIVGSMESTTDHVEGHNLLFKGSLPKVPEAPAKLSVGQYVWNDANKNGIQDPGEKAIPKVTVNLRDNDAKVIKTTITDENGKFIFDGLTPGDYSIEVVKPDGYTFSPQNSGSNRAVDSDVDSKTGIVSFTLKQSDIKLVFDTGMYVPEAPAKLSVGQYVWNDANKNGIQDAGEKAIPKVTVNLRDSDGKVIKTTITDENGKFIFDALTPGNYSIEVVKPDGYTFSPQNSGSNRAVDSDVDSKTGIVSFTLKQSDIKLVFDTGMYVPEAPATLSVGQYVWNDANKNGIQDPGEKAIPKVIVNLRDSDGKVIKTTITDENGKFIFGGLTPGDYSIEVVKPDGYTFSPQNSGSNRTVDSDVDSKTGIVSFTLKQSDTKLIFDTGMYVPEAPAKLSVGQYVWNDANKNGIQDPGEKAIPKVTVNLRDNDAKVIKTTITDENGKFIFDGLTPGNYSIEVVKPDGYTFSPQNSGSNRTVDSDVDSKTGIVSFTLKQSDTKLIFDTGMYVPEEPATLSVGQYVWNDANKNGIQDPGEKAIPKVTVNLRDSDGKVIKTTITDENGKFIFDGLKPGNYSIEVVKPDGYTFSPQNSGSNRTVDSDVDSKTGIVSFTLKQSDTKLIFDTGMYVPVAPVPTPTPTPTTKPVTKPVIKPVTKPAASSTRKIPQTGSMIDCVTLVLGGMVIMLSGVGLLLYRKKKFNN